MRIREALLGDYDDIEKLWLELNEHHAEVEPQLITRVDTYMTRSDYAAVVHDPRQDILVAEKGSCVVGAVWLVERKHQGGHAIEMPVAFIQELCTSAARRGQGIGRLLMQHAEAWARIRGLRRIEFNVWANNRDAIAFYEALGFGYVRHEMARDVN